MKGTKTCYITETQKHQEIQEEACRLIVNMEAVLAQWFLTSLSGSPSTGNDTKLMK